MKPEAQRKRDYEAGYKSAMFSCAAALVVAESDWGKGYEQALLDIKNGKIKLEVER